MLTAYLSKRRKPGKVFLVSRTLIPAACETKVAVYVATPHILCKKFRKVRSSASKSRRLPVTSATIDPANTCIPSGDLTDTERVFLEQVTIFSRSGPPQNTKGSFAIIFP